MTLQVDRQRLAAAHHVVRSRLLSERTADGSHWEGELSSSPLSTATAISALVLAVHDDTSCGLPAFTPGEEPSHVDEIYRNDLSEMIVQSLQWLARQQNDDGGWGDTDRSRSNIATTMLVQAAFHLTGVPAKYQDLLERADAYVHAQGGLSALKDRYEGDKTFAVPILTNCALADMVPWRKVPALPFELSCLPQRWYNRLNLPVVSYAIPALVAIGQAKFHHSPPANPVLRWLRQAAKQRSLAVLAEKQPTSGGFLEATPLTSFVVMSLASIGKADHPVVRQGVEFLLASVRPDGSWPIDTNLATWNTSQALSAINWQFDEQTDGSSEPSPAAHQTLDWLLSCQHRQLHPFTGAAPGGWAWTNLSGGVPDADDTSAALLALAQWHKRWPEHRAGEVRQAALAGIGWLLDLQNRDFGWPTFCRGWGKLPFDRSSTDITAHAIRALRAWTRCVDLDGVSESLGSRTNIATEEGLRFLEKQQHQDGYWLPLWFGNESHPDEANPIYGTSKVLTMYDEIGLGQSSPARRGAQWLATAQHASGGWGSFDEPSAEANSCCSVEETSLAITALLPYAANDQRIEAAVEVGISWLIEAIEQDRHTEPAAIGFYFAKLWYHERLYPQIFATHALAAAARKYAVMEEPLMASH
ncbi:MAG: prenyltransferase/squalene oxidase repeat-containing protein [Planctomycetota bacterium]